MTIQIHDKKKVYMIQKEFSKQFPNLKLEFYSKPHKVGGAPARRLVKQSSKTLAECRTIHQSGKMEISGNVNISELENHFADVYGLGIKVLVKNGRGWKNASKKNSLSLNEQNINAGSSD